MIPKRLVLFDIDGTLLWPDGAGKAAMKAALEHVYGTAGPIETYQFGGYTDRRTVGVLLREAGLPPDRIWDRFEQVGPAMGATLCEALQNNRHAIRPCPGAIELVDALAARKDILPGLVTGNFRQTAPVKLSAAGFDPAVFRVGAYGDEAEDRADLPPRAIERARQLTGGSFNGSQVIIIGDTPDDVLCGRSVGAQSIAVMTGWVERQALEIHQPNYLFDDLSNIQRVLDAIMAPVVED
ncbi:MAG: HAD family hydrolase [Anaerolineae bacterium]|nr:HAD family hydrolase [Anaerolineae bacterium]